jgi:hypothetical protein
MNFKNSILNNIGKEIVRTYEEMHKFREIHAQLKRNFLEILKNELEGEELKGKFIILDDS